MLANNPYPYGQFITTHVGKHYEELTKLVKQGVTLMINDNLEVFNVVAFFVAHLRFVKDVIGLCACTSTYGCYHCLLKREEW